MSNRADTIYLKDYAPPAYLIDSVELQIELGEEQTTVRSRLALRRHGRATAEAPLVLDGEQLQLVGIWLDGRPLAENRYRLADDCLTIPAVPDSFCLETEAILRPQDNTALEGLYRSGGIFCTQCEAEGFRKITWFPDRPDVMSRYTTTIVADRARYPVLLANGNCIEREELADGRHRATWQDPFAKPCYLFALVAGDLGLLEDRFVTASGREVRLQIYVEQHNLGKCAHAMQALQKAMRWDEQTYGLEYDLDRYMIVAVDDFNMGAMENKGLNIFNSKYVLANPETATDADFQAIEEVIAHEYFHNWTGNRVTCRDWFQLSLKEGLTVFRDQHFSADQVSRTVKRIEDVRTLRTHQFAEDAGPLAHAVRPEQYREINNFYTATVYNKGAELVRMLQTMLGEAAFISGVRLYLERHDGQAVTVEDFLAAMAQAGDLDLTQFQRWYRQAGTPLVTVRSRYSAEEGTLELTFSQQCPATPGQPDKEPLHIPCVLALLDGEGRPMPLQLEGTTEDGGEEMIVHLRRREETLRFSGLPQRPVPSLFRGFSAPIRLVADEQVKTLAFLLGKDNDPFNRWDAGQRLAGSIILQRVANPASQGTGAELDALIDSYARILQESGIEPGLVAKLLELPSEIYLAEQMAQIDVEGLCAARQAVHRQIADALRERFLVTWGACRDSAPYRTDPLAVGRRSLKNLCLDYLSATGDAEPLQMVRDSYFCADNMTDRLAALSLLADRDPAASREALEEFYRRAKGDPLVLDKWFAVQARARRPDTLAVVQSLLVHPAYRPQNPNRVRALVGTFSRINLRHFHAADGSGYRLLAEQVKAIDPFNPQLAGFLAGGFSPWRRYDARRREQMQEQLQTIAAGSGLSRDLRDVLGRMLD